MYLDEYYDQPYNISASKESKRGYGLIIVNHFKQFNDYTRIGADMEVQNLTQLFHAFGLETLIYQELEQENILSLISEISKDPKLKHHSIFMLAFSSHGTKEGLLGVNISNRVITGQNDDNDIVSHQLITRSFNSLNCPLLLGKPKVFIFNGCRGDEKERLIQYDAVLFPGIKKDSTISSDCLILYSCVDGYCSLRKEGIGSNFIDILTRVWLNHPNVPLQNTLAYINRQLIIKARHWDEASGKYMSSCCTFHSTLRYTLKVPPIDNVLKHHPASALCDDIPHSKQIKKPSLLWEFVSSGDEVNQLKQPRAVVVNNEGIIYIADLEHNQIQVYDSKRKVYIKSIPNIKMPMYLHIHNDCLYVTSLANTMKVRISDGSILNKYNTEKNIRGITRDASGCILISEKKGLHVHVLNEDLYFMKRMRLEVEQFQISPEAPSQISDIKCYNGEIFVLFQNSKYIVQTFTMTGNLSKSLISSEISLMSRHFYVGNNMVIISDLSAKNVKIFSVITGHILSTLGFTEGPGQIEQPVGVTYDPLTRTIIVVDHFKSENALMCFECLV